MVAPRSNPSASWYTKAKESDPLAQGDMLRSLPIMRPANHLLKLDENARAVIEPIDVIVLSQSCDLMHAGKIDQVQVAPVYTLKGILDEKPNWNNIEMLESLRKNQVARFYLMNVCRSSLFLRGFLLVDFGAVRSVKYKTMIKFKDQAGNRVTLNSPYKEQLSQHFARFYMRVGLPNDIEPFTSTFSQT